MDGLIIAKVDIIDEKKLTKVQISYVQYQLRVCLHL